MNEKCFCHLNGYRVKDSVARQQIEQIGITPQMFGAVGNGIHDDSSSLYALFDNITDNTTVVFPKGHYVIKSFPEDFDGRMNCTVKNGLRSWFLSVVNKKNVTIDLNDSIIELKVMGCLPSGYGFPNYELFNFVDCENFVIKNGTIIGDRTTHFYETPDIQNTGATHEWGCGISIASSGYYERDKSNPVQSVVGNQTGFNCSGHIFNLKIYDFIGDGITVKNGMSEGEINIENCEIYKCRRQGISIGDSDVVIINNCHIHHIGVECDGIIGTAPMLGIDIEPRSGTYCVNKVEIKNTIIDNTGGGGVICDTGYLKQNDVIVIDEYGRKKTASLVKEIMIFDCKTDTIQINARCNYGHQYEYYSTPIIKNCIINHQDSHLSLGAGRYITISNGVFDSCTFNAGPNEMYTRTENKCNYLFFVDKNFIEEAKDPTIKLYNCVINADEDVPIADVSLINSIVNGGKISNLINQANKHIKNCYGTTFNNCQIRTTNGFNHDVTPVTYYQPKYSYVNCLFLNCIESADSSHHPLKFRNCYFNTRLYEKGYYESCIFEDEITDVVSE